MDFEFSEKEFQSHFCTQVLFINISEPLKFQYAKVESRIGACILFVYPLNKPSTHLEIPIWIEEENIDEDGI